MSEPAVQHTPSPQAVLGREQGHPALHALRTSTTDLSQRTEEQAASLEETSTSMGRIAAIVKKNAENAHEANRFATEAGAGRSNGCAPHGGAGEDVRCQGRHRERGDTVS